MVISSLLIQAVALGPRCVPDWPALREKALVDAGLCRIAASSSDS